jgi:hypothetical protein
MGRCQRSTIKSGGGKNCGRPTKPNQRYCARHMGAKPSRNRSRKSNSGNGCGGLFVLALTTLALLAFGILM